jgi:hypothetical protein
LRSWRIHSRTGSIPNSGDNGDSFLSGCRHDSWMDVYANELFRPPSLYPYRGLLTSTTGLTKSGKRCHRSPRSRPRSLEVRLRPVSGSRQVPHKSIPNALRLTGDVFRYQLYGSRHGLGRGNCLTSDDDEIISVSWGIPTEDRKV